MLSNNTNSDSIFSRLESEVFPRLTVDQVFTWEGHNFHESPGKVRGCCPHHESKSGTSWYADTKTLSWRCPGCDMGGGPLQYRHLLRGGNGRPRGKEAIALARELFELAGVPFPDSQISKDELRRLELVDDYRAFLELLYRLSQERLHDGSDESRSALSYLTETRGLTVEAIKELELGLFPEIEAIKSALVDYGLPPRPPFLKGALSTARKDSQGDWHRISHTGYVTIPWRDQGGNALTLYGAWMGTRYPVDHPDYRPHKIALPNLTNGKKGDQRVELMRSKRSPYLFDHTHRAGHKHIIVVEGVFDAAVAHSKGDSRVVACVAAQLSKAQAKTLAGAGIQTVTIALDPDKAGDAGIASCIRSLREVGVTALVAPRLPDNTDPDDFIIEHGVDAWRDHIDSAITAVTHEATAILDGYKDGSEAAKHTQMAEIHKYLSSRRLSPTQAEEIESIMRKKTGLKAGTCRELIQKAQTEADTAFESEVAAKKTSKYLFDDDGVSYLKTHRNGESVTVRLCNFIPAFTGEIILDNSIDQIRLFEVTITIGGKKLAPFQIPASEFSGFAWLHDKAGSAATIYPDEYRARHHIETAMAEARNELGDAFPIRRVYGHTGWRKIGDTHAYLVRNGAITADGLNNAVNVCLPDGRLQYELPAPASGEERVAVIRSSLRILDLLGRAAFALLGAIYRAPLGPADFGLFIEGQTGTMKTEAAAIMQQHFGVKMDSRHLPCSWSSTANSIEAMGFAIKDAIKDAILVIDDFCPRGTRNEIARLGSSADRVFRGAGNGSGRSRLNADGSMQATKHTRSLVVATGEDVPNGQSLQARLLVVPFTTSTVDKMSLTELQKAGRNGDLAITMSSYIRWLACDYESRVANAQMRVSELRSELVGAGNHLRMPTTIANLLVGIQRFLLFATDCDAITEHEAHELRKQGRASLLALANQQTDIIGDDDQVGEFLRLLTASVDANDAYFCDVDTNDSPADCADRYGWVRGEFGFQFKHAAKKIGYVRIPRSCGPDCDSECPQPHFVHGKADFFLIPDQALAAAKRMKQNFSITRQTLARRMSERGIIGETKKMQVDGRRDRVWKITDEYRHLVLQSEDSFASSAQSLPDAIADSSERS